MSDDKRIEAAIKFLVSPAFPVGAITASAGMQSMMQTGANLLAAIDAADAARGVVRVKADTEPVAWGLFSTILSDNEKCGCAWGDEEFARGAAEQWDTVRPLYTHPPRPTEVSDAMVEAAQAAWGECMCPEQTIHDTFRRMLQAALTAALAVR